MADILTIELKRLHFFANHGLYPQEKKTGNEFEISLFVSFIPAQVVINDVQHSINYVSLYELLASEMKIHRDLLETFVMEITEKIKNSFPFVTKVEIAIDKLTPPVNQFTGSVGVRYVKEF